jgi:hypothetical protein
VEVFSLQRDTVTSDTLGLQLSEAKDLLTAVQDTLADAQVSTAVAAQVRSRKQRICRSAATSGPASKAAPSTL